MSRTAAGAYRCSWCKANLSEGEAEPNPSEHISLVIGAGSGIATNVGPLPGWRVYRKFEPGVHHWCNTEHQKHWFDAVLPLLQGGQP